MIVRCAKCLMYFQDELRSTICPHAAFAANDGMNNFTVHEDAYLSELSEEERNTILQERK